MLRRQIQQSVIRKLTGSRTTGCVRFASEKLPALLGDPEAGLHKDTGDAPWDMYDDPNVKPSAVADDYQFRHSGTGAVGYPYNMLADPGVGTPNKRRTVPWDYQTHLFKHWDNDTKVYYFFYDPERYRTMWGAFFAYMFGLSPIWILAAHLALDLDAPNVFGMNWVVMMCVYIYYCGKERASRPALYISGWSNISNGCFPFWGSPEIDYHNVKPIPFSRYPGKALED